MTASGYSEYISAGACVIASGYRNTLVDSLRLQEYISVKASAKHSACNLIAAHTTLLSSSIDI